MKCGVKFCGGCNPRYERSEALDIIRKQFEGQIEFEYAKEGVLYDLLLVIGGCTSCCASFDQYMTKHGCIKIWEKGHAENAIKELERIQINK